MKKTEYSFRLDGDTLYATAKMSQKHLGVSLTLNTSCDTIITGRGD